MAEEKIVQIPRVKLGSQGLEVKPSLMLDFDLPAMASRVMLDFLHVLTYIFYFAQVGYLTCLPIFLMKCLKGKMR
jgi:hypothetical protein